jgi:hypothetical protein
MLGNSDDGVLSGYGTYDSGSSIGVGYNGGLLASPDRMAKKMMAAECSGLEVWAARYGKVHPTKAMANRGSVVDCGWRCLGVEVWWR